MVVRRLVEQFNGITIAYVMGLLNALLAVLLAFNVHLNNEQESAIVAFVNASLIVVAHVGHRLGEQIPNGAEQ